MQGSSYLMEHVQHKHYYWPLALFSEKQKKMKGKIINEPRHMQVLTHTHAGFTERENRRLRPCHIDRAIARSIRQGRGLRFSR